VIDLGSVLDYSDGYEIAREEDDSSAWILPKRIGVSGRNAGTFEIADL
jgi:hypothetical protein